MGTKEEKIELYSNDIKKFDNGKVDLEFLEIVVKNLGPSIYKADAEKVSCSSKEEMERVRKNFIEKKLGVMDADLANKVIQETCEKVGKSNRNKYRATFYYFIAKALNKTSALS